MQGDDERYVKASSCCKHYAAYNLLITSLFFLFFALLFLLFFFFVAFFFAKQHMSVYKNKIHTQIKKILQIHREEADGYTRHNFNAIVSETDLNDTYLVPFKYCAEKGETNVFFFFFGF